MYHTDLSPAPPRFFWCIDHSAGILNILVVSIFNIQPFIWILSGRPCSERIAQYCFSVKIQWWRKLIRQRIAFNNILLFLNVIAFCYTLIQCLSIHHFIGLTSEGIIMYGIVFWSEMIECYVAGKGIGLYGGQHNHWYASANYLILLRMRSHIVADEQPTAL